MPPKRKAPAAAAAAAGKGNAKKYGKAPELPEGEILTDFTKKQWRLGRSIGSGGFGRIYLATKVGEKGLQYVVKMEPSNNGPLFQEIHFYQRVGKEDLLQNWKKKQGLKFLGIPSFIAAGLHTTNGIDFRFLIMPRLGADLENYRESCEQGRLGSAFTFRLANCILDSLEYLHYSAQYVHADVKAENLLAASDKSTDKPDQYYLVDYGLARKVADEPIYKEAPKKAHDGTLIFTSLDAHRGCTPSYRGDVEILGYNILYWITGSLPWEKVNDPVKVFEAKKAFSKNYRTELTRWPLLSTFAADLTEFFEYVYSLDYDARPDFDQLRQFMTSASTKTKSKRDRSTSSASSPARATSSKLKSRTSSTPARATTSKVKSSQEAPSTETRRKSPIVRAPSTETRRKSQIVRSNGVSAASAKKEILLQHFINARDSSSNGSTNDDDDEEELEETNTSSLKNLTRPGLKKKIILAVDSPVDLPTASQAVSPRSIIPGKANLRRFDASAAARRRSSIMVKKKYFPKKTTTASVKATVTVKTRGSKNGKKTKSYRISSSSEDGE